MYEDLSDIDLLQRCRAGQAGAWATLVRRYQRLIYTVALRGGLPEAAAADVFQITFARLFENLHRIDDDSRVRAWLVTTAKRETLLQAEQARRQVDLGDDSEDPEQGMAALPDPAPLAPELLSQLQESDLLRRAVAQLDPKAREFVEFVFLQDDPPSYGEIAARLGIAEGSIGPTRMRCLDKLRKILAKM